MLNDRALRINFGKTAVDGDARDGDGGGGGGMVSTPLSDHNYLNLGPPQPPAPHDLKQKDVIEKVATQVLKHGPSFEDMVKEKQKSNVIFDFLNDGGLYADYYRWKLFDLRRAQKESEANPYQTLIQRGLQANQDRDRDHFDQRYNQPPPQFQQPLNPSFNSQFQQQQPQGPPRAPPHYGPPLSDHDRAQLSQMLDSLVPTKDSIKKGKDHIIELERCASAVAAFMCERLIKTPDWSAKLNIIYLTNDVLHHW
jgi:hypothetical protein